MRLTHDKDGNLKYALRCNEHCGLAYEEIGEIVTMIEGENEGANWHWLCTLKDGAWAYVTGGCDYTGWD
jgi:hypothetical protein